MYVLVRNDLTLPQQMVQAAHAAHEAGIHLADKTGDIASIVICGVAEERTLLQEQARLAVAGIQTLLFREPDMGDAATALASAPIRGETRRHFRRYKLWVPPT